MMTKSEAKAALEKVMAIANAEQFSATLSGGQTSNVRFARNTITTSGHVSTLTLVFTAQYGKKQGSATTTKLDNASLTTVVRRAEELAKFSPDNEEVMDMLGPQKYMESPGFVESSAKPQPEFLAEAASSSFLPCRGKEMTAAGFLTQGANFTATMNSKGLFAYYASTDATCTTTVRTDDGTGSGWASAESNDLAKLDAKQAAETARFKALKSAQPKALEPGKYTVILEPAASVGLLQRMGFSFAARSADEGRSFLTKKGGGNKLGEKLFDERVTIYTDPTDPRVPTQPFDGEGYPREKSVFIEKGVVKNMFYSRYWAEKQGKKPLPFPGNMIMMGGDESLEDMIKSTKRGLLVTRLWYIRSVDPQTLLNTGLTRDGLFYIEDGKIAYPIKNFRFNESPVIMLNNLESLGEPERINGSLIPPMKIRDFTFTSTSDAV